MRLSDLHAGSQDRGTKIKILESWKIQTSESQLEISTADFKSQDCNQGVGSRPKFQRLNSKPRYQNSSSLRDLAVFVFPLEVV